MNNIKKPEKHSIDYFEYVEIIDYIGTKYNIDIYDYLNTKKRKEDWCKENGGISLYASPRQYGGKFYAHIDCKGDLIEVSEDEYKIQWKIYYDNCGKFNEWEKTQPVIEKLDYESYLFDRDFSDVQKDSYIYWNIVDIIENSNYADWVKEITKLIYNEFKEYLDENGCLCIHFYW